MSDFYKRLKELRANAGLTQKELADSLNVTQTAITYWENEKREPSLDMIAKIADYFNVSVESLLTKDEYTQLEEYEQKQREEAAKKAPKFTVRAEGAKKPHNFFTRNKKENATQDGPIPKFTCASRSNAQTEVYDLFHSLLSEEWIMTQEQEVIAVQLRNILSTYNELNDIGRKMAVKRVEELRYSDIMTDSQQDDIYFDRIKKKINNGEKLTPDEIEWWHNYLDTSVKTVGAIFESLFSMLNKEGRRKAHTQINRAIDQIELLTKIPEYQKKPPDPPQE